MAVEIPEYLPETTGKLLDAYGVTTEEREFVARGPIVYGMGKSPDEVALACLLSRESYRMNWLYHIKDQWGKAIQYYRNPGQQYVASKTHNRKLILKSRKHGITTEHCLKFLDKVLFSPTQRAGIVAQTEDDAKNFLKDKVRFAYDRLPDFIKDHPNHKIISQPSDLLGFGNGSSIYVDCSLKSDTVQYLLISEYGWLCSESPDKAESIINGALNSVFAGQEVVIESTSERLGVDFQERCTEAINLAMSGKALNLLEFQFIFLGWYCDRRNRLDPDSVVMTKEDQEYFTLIEPDVKKLSDRGIIMPIPGGSLNAHQKAWYVAKKREQKKLMLTQHPSTPDEALGGEQEGKFFREDLALAHEQKRIKSAPYIPGYPVNTSWDFGGITAIWFHQNIKGEDRLIHYYEKFGGDFPDHVRYMQNLGYYAWGAHYIPHDGSHSRYGLEVTNYRKILEDLGLRNIVQVPRASKKTAARSVAKSFLAVCVFDEENTAKGRERLENYQRRYIPKMKIYVEEELEDDNVHGSDALICLAEGRNMYADTNHNASKFLLDRKKPDMSAFR
jgi:hypothetical protein